MKMIPSRDFRIRPGGVWKDLKEARELVITSKGMPVAVMVPTDAGTLEDTLQAIRRARAVAAVRAIRRDVRRKGIKMSMRQVDKVIAEVRKERRKRGG